MNYEQIRYETQGEVAIITLNRPERLNAWTTRMSAEQAHAIQTANNDPKIGAIVMTGAGRGFCAGADIADNFNQRIKKQDAGDVDGAARDGGMSEGVDWNALVRESKPMIAAVNGHSVGIGVTMILAFDIIIASEAAKFVFAFVRMGLVPELGSSHLLQQRVGFGRANELCLTARTVSATEAAQIGLVEKVVAPEALLDEALATARMIAAFPDGSLRATKQLLTANRNETDMKIVQMREMEKMKERYVSAEHKEAVAAFLEKRPAKFR
ncbi:enoyl-CoA hydratase/isomerase family protein [Zavarzinia sp. CC-PAN008]|uniref:enoyl-CoA hydratase/isomerase family protein n=1 Tax=Zavarzinia sp. CC-PAN008 TaxID=3243332 RepID=UPI003F742E8D